MYVLLEDRKSSEAERGSGVYNDLSLNYPYILLIQLSIFLLWFFFKLPQKRDTTIDVILITDMPSVLNRPGARRVSRHSRY